MSGPRPKVQISPTTADLASSGRGAYGLRLEGVDRADALLVRGKSEWPVLKLESHVTAAAPLIADHIGPDSAMIRLRDGGRVEISSELAVFYLDRELAAEELVHPYLAPVAAVVGSWLGRESLHAGAAVVGGRVWALLGDRESGKSSTLAALAAAGHPVVADDVLVLDGPTPFVGPRTVDLRADAPAHLGGAAIDTATARARHRVVLPAPPDELVLGGWIFLEWGAHQERRRLAPGEAFGRLAAARVLRIPPRDPGLLLQLAGLDAWELRRPRKWASLGPTLAAVGELAGL